MGQFDNGSQYVILLLTLQVTYFEKTGSPLPLFVAKLS